MTESIQKRLLRVRPPRVRITYDVETGGAMEKTELPFIVGILANLQGDREPDSAQPLPLKERTMFDIDRDCFDDVMKSIGPGVVLDMKLPGLEQLRLSDVAADKFVRFGGIDDFHPLKLVMALPRLRMSYMARNQIRWLQSKAEASAPVADMLERWLKFDVQKDESDSALIRTELPKILNAVQLDDKEKPALRSALLALFDALQLLGREPAKELSVEDAQADEKLLEDNAIEALAAWGLVPAIASAADQKPEPSPETVIGYGRLILDAIALVDNFENQKTAIALVKYLNGAGAGDASTIAQLGFADATAATTVMTQIAQGLDSTDSQVRGPLLAKALFLAGLHSPDSRSAVKIPSASGGELAVKAYQNDCADAEGRGQFLSVLNYLHATGGANAPALGRELFKLVALLRPNKMVSVAAIVYRLHYFVEQIVLPWQNDEAYLLDAKKRGVCAVIDERVVFIEQGLSRALSAIMHMPIFRSLEASWRGLHYLVFRSETSKMLKLKVFNATMNELRKDMEGAVEFDQSALFKLVYEAEYGTYGGFPYSMLVGDYAIGAQGEDIDFIKKMAEVAAAAHAPFIAAAAPSLFGLESYDELERPRDLTKLFEGQEMEAWREFRDMEDARYVTLVLPRTLLRLPYGKAEKRNTTVCEGLDFEEQVSVAGTATVSARDEHGAPLSYNRPDTDNFLWGNASYVLAERITNAFSLYGWTAAIRGVEGGGLVEGLPLYSYASDSGSTELFCPTEVTITDRREKELSDLGFLSLCHCKGTSDAAFFGGQTTNNPKRYFSPDANANAKLSAMLPYMLAASRFAHYIKVIMRKKVGSFMTRSNVESHLNNWIAHYVLLDDNAPQDAKAAFPLRAASVQVTDMPGEPGRYNATVFLKPHFQLEELSTSIRLVATLPGG